MDKKLNKATLIAEVAEKTGEPKASVERVLAAFQDVVIEHVAAGEEVSLTGFFSAKPRVRAARDTRNPRTGETIAVPEKTVVSLKPLRRFADAVAEGGKK